MSPYIDEGTLDCMCLVGLKEKIRMRFRWGVGCIISGDCCLVEYFPMKSYVIFVYYKVGCNNKWQHHSNYWTTFLDLWPKHKNCVFHEGLVQRRSFPWQTVPADHDNPPTPECNMHIARQRTPTMTALWAAPIRCSTSWHITLTFINLQLCYQFCDSPLRHSSEP